MKKIFNILSLATVLFVASCSKSVEDVNISPNSPTDAPSDLLLNGAQVSSIVFYEGEWARLSGMWSQSFTGMDRQYVSLNNYTTTSGDYDATWSTAYRGVIAPCSIIISKEKANNNKLMIGIAQVMQAQAFGTLADLFGDVPFSEAANPSKYPHPKFDKQVDVYAGVQSLLDDAISNIASGIGVSPGSKDIFYGGDEDKWIAAAHTLKARFYLHTKNYTEAINEVASGISKAEDNMMAPHGPSYNSDFNLYYSFYIYDRYDYMSADAALAPKLLDAADATNYRGNIKTNEEARFNYLFLAGGTASDAGVYDLNVLCDFDWGVPSDYNGFFGGTTSFPLVTYQENILTLAEAKIHNDDFTGSINALNEYRVFLNAGGYLGAGYKTLFNHTYDAYVAADFETGGMENHGGTKNESLLKEIIEERYVTFIGQLEQFNDVRRTRNAIGLTPVSGTTIPQRFFYPQSEINTNPNTPSQLPIDLFKPTTVNQ
jgi:hypothetical protein